MFNLKKRKLIKKMKNCKNKGFFKLISTILTAAFLVTGCASEGTETSGGDDMSATTSSVLVKSYEAEEGSFSGNVKTATRLSGFSGEGYVEGFQEDEDSCSLTVEVPEDGFYNLVFTAASLGGHKENYVFVDDEKVGYIASDCESFEDEASNSTVTRVYMTAGEHVVRLTKYWGYIAFDKMDLMTSESLPGDYYQAKVKLNNPNASENAKRLMSFLADNYGKNILSGQYSSEGLYGHENACIWSETGKFPAVLGLDMIEYSPSRVANGSTGKSIEYAIEAWDKNVVVTMCWHWNAPQKYLTGTWYSGFYKEHTNIDLDKIMSGEDQEGYELLISDMDEIASQLVRLKEADVPVLWRPLHEASGGWFWWGDCKAESYKALYRLMYEKFTNEYELNNLIWLWNGQNPDWYPGDDVTDMSGIDIYAGEHVYTSQINSFMEVKGWSGENKIVCMSENGTLFDPDLAIRDDAMWSFFCTWSGEFVAASKTLNRVSEQYTEKDMIKKVYNHENVLTMDELPELKTYPIREDVAGE